MNDRQKTVIAGISSVLVVALIVFGIAWFTSPGFRDSLNPSSDDTNLASEGINQAISRNEELLSSFNEITDKDVLYTEISLNDIPLYPESWQKKYFSLNERLDENIGSPQADADNDGLTNRAEYFLGSDPRNEFTRCLVNNVDNCDERNDSQNVAQKIHPLTGLELLEPVNFRVARQDLVIIEQAEENFDTASEEGVDFPSLYYLSQTIDLSDELKEVSVISVEDDRDNIIKFQKFRISTLQTLADQNLLKEFNSIYSIFNPEELETLGDDYQKLIDTMKEYAVPERYADMHRANIFAYQKIVELIRHRTNGLREELITTQDFKDTSKRLAIETVWGYIELAEATPRS